MSQSTIHKRNLRRLARSQENINDGRLPVIRVMAGLPLLGQFVPRLQEASSNEYQSDVSTFDGITGRNVEASFYNANEKQNSDSLPLILAGFAGATMMASSYSRRALSSVPMVMLSSQGSWTTSNRVSRMRAAPACCALLMTANVLVRSVRPTVSKI